MALATLGLSLTTHNYNMIYSACAYMYNMSITMMHDTLIKARDYIKDMHCMTDPELGKWEECEHVRVCGVHVRVCMHK